MALPLPLGFRILFFVILGSEEVLLPRRVRRLLHRRLAPGFFINNNGSAPPVGWVDPANYHAADGGRPWPQYVAQYAGVDVYNYAVSGAVCSNEITPRWFSAINAPFPDIAGYELPAYIADSHYVYPNGTKFMNDVPSSTVYAIWIGTNDLGNYAFITDSQVPGTNLTSYVDCVYDQISRVYANGGRYFVIMNIAPLELAPQYSPPSKGGLNATQYWPDKTNSSGGNITEISYRMMEQVETVNAIYDYRTPFAAVISDKYPGAHFAVYDVNALMTDIYNNPSEYLNGTQPLDVESYAHKCNTSGADCVLAASPDSFMWYDELHPSEQTERVVARTFVDVVKGTSKWATYWS
ncbi:hypothetical protein H2203_002278 [Taxawa tesnikishii (nom. ined.)]|nr:hypothetical protein H2203_002278 [Dothideales sp. JES 119]